MNISISAVFRKDRLNSQNAAPVHLRLTQNRKLKHISTGVTLNINEWDFENQRVKGQTPELQALQLRIDTKIDEFRRKIKRLEALEVEVTLDNLLETNGRKINCTVGEYLKQTIERLNVVVRTKNLGVIAQRVRGEGTMAVPKPDDLAVIIYTSGTTSKPKGVMLTHAALCAQVGISSGIFPVLPDDVFLSVLPLSHTYECSIGMIYPFSMGARVVYLDRPPTASALMPALRAVRPSVMLIVPLIIEKIYRHQVLAKFNSNGFWRTLYKVGFLRRYLHRVAGKKLLKLFGGRLRFLGIGGAKLDGGAEKFLLEAKVPYAIGYGLTETAPLLAGAAPSQVRLGSTGPQAPGVQLRLENINPDTRQGEVVALTPSVMLGYFKNPEATKEVFTDDGWFRTGDLGEFDKDGWLYIKGRLKNMIVGPGGENIYPEDIETVLNSHVYIADSIVTEQEGRLVALVHFNRDEIEAMIDNWREEWETKKEAWEAKTEQLKKEIMDFVNAKVNRFSRISEVVEEKDDFAKTPTHKIKRFLYNRSKDNDKPQREQPAGKPETK